MDLIVDGYNLIGNNRGLDGALEQKRGWLVRQLTRYQKIKGFNITIVFDGWRTGRVSENIEKSAGVSVIYSRLGEKADAVIVRLAREKSDGSVVATSDREIRSAVERSGAVAVSADELNRILRSLDGFSEEDDVDDGDFPAAKGGNPNRLSKAERRRREKLKKLKL
jgi:uncharacterized protein